MAPITQENPSAQWFGTVLPTLAEAELGVVIHFGPAGRGLADTLSAQPLQRLVRVEPDPDTVEALRATTADAAHVQVIEAAVGPDDGAATLTLFSMDEATSWHPATGLKTLFPGLRETGSIPVKLRAAAEICDQADLSQDGAHLLILGASGAELPVLKALIASGHLARFSHVVVPLPALPLYENAADGAALRACLEEAGFRLKSTDPSDPDRTIGHFLRDKAVMDLREKLAAAQAELDEKRKELQNVTSSLARQTTEVKRLDKTVGTLTVDLAERDKALAQRDDTIAELQKVRHEQAARLAQQAKTHEQRSADIDDLRQRLDARKENIAALKEVIDRRDAQIDEMKARIATQSAAQETLQERLTESAAQAERFAAQATSLVASRNRIAELEDAVARKAAQIAELQQVRHEQAARLAQQAKTHEQRSADIDDLRQRLDARKENVAALKEVIDRRDAQIDEMKARITKQSAAQETLQERLTESEAQADARKENASALKEAIAKRDAQIDEMKARIAKQSAAQETLQERLTESEAQAVARKENVAALKEDIAERDAQIGEMKASIATQSTAQEAMIAEQQEAISAAERERHQHGNLSEILFHAASLDLPAVPGQPRIAQARTRFAAEHLALLNGPLRPLVEDSLKTEAFHKDFFVQTSTRTAATSDHHLVLDIKSIPRSGLHYMKRTLSGIFQDQFSSCEWYQEPGCCRSMPCIYAQATPTSAGSASLRFLKSHDFKMADPVYPLTPGMQRLILTRSPLFSLTSHWILTLLQRNHALLEAHGIHMDKIYYLHEAAVLRSAYALLDESCALPSRDGVAKWLDEQKHYRVDFSKKWGQAAAMPRTYVVPYEKTPQAILACLAPIEGRLSPDQKSRLDRFRDTWEAGFRMRSNPFDGPTPFLSQLLQDHAELFHEAAEWTLTHDESGLLDGA